MFDPTPEQIEAGRNAMMTIGAGRFGLSVVERGMSLQDAYGELSRAALVAAAGAAPQEQLEKPADLSIMNGWLVESVGKHTCGAGMDGYGHEPGCGYMPVLNLAELDGYPKRSAEAVEGVSNLHVCVLRGKSISGEELKSWCKHCDTAYPCETMQALELERDCECYGADGVTDQKCNACAVAVQVDEAKLADVIWAEQSSRVLDGYVIHTRETAASTARAVAEWLRGGEQ